jgi:phosphate transport system substrate-binding protein
MSVPAGGTSGAPSGSTPAVVRPPSSRGWMVAVVVVVILVVAGLAIGYQQHWFGSSNTSSGTCASGVTLLGNGAQFVAPLVNQWTTSYTAQTSNLVDYPAAGSGTGITQFSEHPPLIDFAITDDPLSSSEVSALPATALTLPIAGGALAMVYNLPGVTGHLNFSGTVLAGVYNGSIGNWNDSAIQAINPGVTLPNATILTVHRSDAAGTTYVLTDFLSQDNAAWAAGPGKGISISWPSAPDQVAIKGNSALLSEVETTPDAIGYSDLTDVLTASTTLQYAAVQNPKGDFVVPTLASTASAIADKSATTTFPASTGNWYNVSMVNAEGTGDYPLATFAFMFVYQNLSAGYEPSLSKSQVLLQWLDWVLTTGQTYANDTSRNLYYVPLPSALVTIDQAGVQSMTFNGAAIPSCS